MGKSRDPRYGTSRWQRVRLGVLRRDMWTCWVAGCDRPGRVADHIEPASVDMPNERFYATTNLRASCYRHNTYRGIAAAMERDLAGKAEPEPKRRPLAVKPWR